MKFCFDHEVILNRSLQLLRFFIFEVIVKTIVLCLITTFTTAALLSLTPKAEIKAVPVRGGERETTPALPQKSKEVGVPQLGSATTGFDSAGGFRQSDRSKRAEMESISSDREHEPLTAMKAAKTEESGVKRTMVPEIDPSGKSTRQPHQPAFDETHQSSAPLSERGRASKTPANALQTEHKKSSGFLADYTRWWHGVLLGDIGRGEAGQRVAEEIKEKLPVTFILSSFSFFPAIIISLFLGLSEDNCKIRILKNTIYFLSALPAFFLGYALMGQIGYYVSSMAPQYVLAIVTLGLSSGIVNELVRVVESSMEVEMTKEYIETARAKGLSESTFPRRGTVRFHAYKNARINIIPRAGAIFTFIISGSLVVEYVFNLPGLSKMLLEGLANRDAARVLIIIVLGVLLVRAVSLTSNLLYLLLNPKYGERA